MKYIEKSKEPRSLTQVKTLRYPKLKLSFDNLPPNVLADLIHNLLMDQGFICCYTMDEITPETAVLVHFNPQKYFPDQELDYNNLYLALRQPDELPPAYRAGYTSKEDAVIPNYLADLRCSTYFRYNTLGEIIPNGTFRTIKNAGIIFVNLPPNSKPSWPPLKCLI
ncbi:MAG: hypothetical protein HC880_02930 [Bacteroidia bacterium]|nr:hypothetical protein [Bacteroidia bacterium]